MARPTVSYGFQHHLREKKRKKQRKKILLYSVLFLLVCGSLIYVLFFGAYFTIQSVEVGGSEIASPDAIRNSIADLLAQKSFFILKDSNILLFPAHEAENKLQDAFPSIAQARVTKQLNPFHFMKESKKSQLVVSVIERPRTALACDQSRRCFFVDDTGVLFAPSPSISGASVLFIQEADLSNVVIPFKKYAREFIDFIKYAKIAASNDNGITFDSFTLINELGDIEARAREDFRVLFTVNQSPEKQTKILKGILAKMPTEDVAKLDYVDLRVENRAYYKLK